VKSLLRKKKKKFKGCEVKCGKMSVDPRVRGVPLGLKRPPSSPLVSWEIKRDLSQQRTRKGEKGGGPFAGPAH